MGGRMVAIEIVLLVLFAGCCALTYDRYTASATAFDISFRFAASSIAGEPVGAELRK